MKKLIAAFLVTVAACAATAAQAAEKVTVFAAASMKDVIEQAAKEFKAKDGTEVVASFASSSVLAKQIEQGAPAQIFISADLDWMDYAQKAGTIDAATRKVIAGNALVIATQKGTPKGDAKTLLTAGRFSMGDPSNVPAGKYAKAALEKLDLWKTVQKNAVFAENVRVALQYVSRGEVKAGIVYASDRIAAPDLIEAYRFPASSHEPILYPAALVQKNETPAAKAFLAFLESDAGLAMRATGANPRMARAQGVDSAGQIYLGMAISNALVALGGALFAQTNGFADVTSGVGTIVVGLAAVIIGETLFGARGILMALIGCVIGSILYRIAIQLALSSDALGLQASDLNLVTAVLVTFALVLPRLRNGGGR